MSHLRSKPEKLPFRVTKGGFEPADGYVAAQMKKRGYNIGDLVFCVITKPRTHGLNRASHKLGNLVTENIEDFHGMEGHQALKRLQMEAGAGCDEIIAYMDIMGQRIKVLQRIPRSLGYESMDESEFRATMRQIADYIALNYWPGVSPEKIEEMAEFMPDPV